MYDLFVSDTGNLLTDIIVFSVIGLVLYILVAIFIRNMPINIGQLQRTDKFIIKTFRKIAMNIVMNDFRQLNKPTHTKKGNYRADFLKAISKKQEELMNICFSGNCFSDDFCSYVQRNYKSIVRKKLYSIVFDYIRYREYAIEENFTRFVMSSNSISPDVFFDIKSQQKGDIVGVYILHNKTKDMYYVGQAKRIFFRLNQHFTGHGNGDVYADYKYGDDFAIKIIKLSESGYSDLDKLEKDLIDKYDAYNSGYNRTSGNR